MPMESKDPLLEQSHPPLKRLQPRLLVTPHLRRQAGQPVGLWGTFMTQTKIKTRDIFRAYLKVGMEILCSMKGTQGKGRNSLGAI